MDFNWAFRCWKELEGGANRGLLLVVVLVPFLESLLLGVAILSI